jgi:hypothetical protein
VALIDRGVWFFLIEARVIGTGARLLRAGSQPGLDAVHLT